MKIISVVGARPNFMKIAPFIRAVEAYNKTNAAGIEHLLVHTGQHYDDKMSSAFSKPWTFRMQISTWTLGPGPMPSRWARP